MGSWGSAERTKGLNIYCPGPGAHHAFRAAVTSLCTGVDDSRRDRRASKLPSIKPKCGCSRTCPILHALQRHVVQHWGHGYAISALVRMHDRKPDDDVSPRQDSQADRRTFERLNRYERSTADGGYTFSCWPKKSGADSTSFMNAAV